ncbi:unnamed protein product, partial [Symbiodinium pilosum]
EWRGDVDRLRPPAAKRPQREKDGQTTEPAARTQQGARGKKGPELCTEEEERVISRELRALEEEECRQQYEAMQAEEADRDNDLYEAMEEQLAIEAYEDYQRQQLQRGGDTGAATALDEENSQEEEATEGSGARHSG